MTLAPVFRSERAVRLLQDGGLLDLLGPALERQRLATDRVLADFADLAPGGLAGTRPPTSRLEFLQEFFFLTLFGAAFEAVGVPTPRLDLYAEVDFCVMGTITAADNLFDDEDKAALPLADVPGARFRSIVQLIAFERLLQRVGDRAISAGIGDPAAFAAVRRDLLGGMVDIGRLEGSEEGGVSHVPDPDAMLRAVHAVRGGQLFGLATVAPHVLEEGPLLRRIELVEGPLVALGTAVQVVDDLTDFEIDLPRRSHNLLTSWIHHRGDDRERRVLRLLRAGDSMPADVVETHFATSARAVLDVARGMGREAFAGLRGLGLAVPTEAADAVVGIQGAPRMEALSGEFAAQGEA